MKKFALFLLCCTLSLSCSKTKRKNKFEDENAMYIKLDESERLEGVTFNEGMYIWTRLDTTPPQKHYLQRRNSDGLLEVIFVIEEQ